MSSEEKLKLLDDKFLEAESAKNNAINEIQQLSLRFKDIVSSLGGDTDPKQIQQVFGTLKQFLSSTITTIVSIQQSIDGTMNQFRNISNTLKQLGI